MRAVRVLGRPGPASWGAPCLRARRQAGRASAGVSEVAGCDPGWRRARLFPGASGPRRPGRPSLGGPALGRRPRAGAGRPAAGAPPTLLRCQAEPRARRPVLPMRMRVPDAASPRRPGSRVPGSLGRLGLPRLRAFYHKDVTVRRGRSFQTCWGRETVAGCRAVFGSDRGGARLGRSVRASPKGMVRKTGKIENNSSKYWSGYCMLGSVAIFLHRLLYLILRVDFSSTIIVPTYR